MKYINSPNCNRCSTNCKGIRLTSVLTLFKYRSDYNFMLACKKFMPPIEGWSLAELALAHPTSLNEALGALPFKVLLEDYLPKGVSL